MFRKVFPLSSSATLCLHFPVSIPSMNASYTNKQHVNVASHVFLALIINLFLK